LFAGGIYIGGRGWGHIMESGVLQISPCPRWSQGMLIWGPPLSKGVPLPPPLSLCSLMVWKRSLLFM